MAIGIKYDGPYRIKRFKTDGEFNYEKMRDMLKSQVPKHVHESSGVYIYFMDYRGKFTARYVGVNKSNGLFREALLKKSILRKKIFFDGGRPSILFLCCSKPKRMTTRKFQDRLRDLEKSLIIDLSLRGHELLNDQLMPKDSKFDFHSSRTNEGRKTFKKLIGGTRKPHV